METRKASIKETGEELSQEKWARFEDAAEKVQGDRRKTRVEDATQDVRAETRPDVEKQ